MKSFLKIAALLALTLLIAAPAQAALAKISKSEKPEQFQDRILGNENAPVTVQEFVSLTCPHCADFYNTTLPALKKKYLDSGKVRFILRDFPLDGTSLKAAALARCMPADEYYPFITVLYQNQSKWAYIPNPESVLVQYAKLGGLEGDKADACLKNTDMQNKVVAERTNAQQQYGITATPTFLITGPDKKTEKIEGAQPPESFASVFDRMLAEKH